MEIKGQNKSRTVKNARAKSSPGVKSYLKSNVGVLVCSYFLLIFICLFVSVESQKDENDLNEEQEILTEMMQVIEQRDKLVDSLEEQRVQEKAEDQRFESFIFSRGCQLSRT